MADVFVIHAGNQDYLRQSLRCAAAYGNNVLYIGDTPAYATAPGNYLPYDVAPPPYQVFESAYRHMCHNSEAFEKACFKRWFLLQHYANELGLKKLWMIDSDVLLLEDLSGLQDYLAENAYSSAVSSPYPLSSIVSPHMSFWTLEALNDLIDFILNIYQHDIGKLEEIWQDYLRNGHGGGISDMTLLALWAGAERHRIYNTAGAHLDIGTFYDHNINMAFNVDGEPPFHMIQGHGLKHIHVKDGRHHVLKAGEAGAEYPVGCLHFQGVAKKYMPLLNVGV